MTKYSEMLASRTGITAKETTKVIEKIKQTDTEMATGKLLDAENTIRHVYEMTKTPEYNTFHNIACIYYSNVLACLGKTSIALSYYEKGLKLSKYSWDFLYGMICRSVSLAAFHETNAINHIEDCEKTATKKGYNYLTNLARAFKVICKHELGIEIAESEISAIDKKNTPELRLVTITLLLLHAEDSIETKKYVDEIYELIKICQGVIGKDRYLGKLVQKKNHIFYDMDQNKQLLEWINIYEDPFIKANKDVEDALFSNYNKEPLLYPCDLSHCCGYCCYDGVYLQEGEKEKIAEYIKQHETDFQYDVSEYFMQGTWVGLEGRIKTATKPFENYQDDFPKHFEHTRCMFSDENGICELQKAATKNGEHPWKVKPRSCWLFPLEICSESKDIAPRIGSGEKDPDYIDSTYPGYVSFLRCGIEQSDGIPWRLLYKQEILYYEYFYKGLTN